MDDWFWILLVLEAWVLGNLVLGMYYVKANVPKRGQAGCLELPVGLLS